MPKLVSVAAERSFRSVMKDLAAKLVKLTEFKYVPVAYNPVDFSDVLPAEVVEKVAETLKDLWALAIPVVSFLAEFYGIDRDDFVSEVLVRAMPTLQQCRTVQNPSGKYDLIDQGVWGQAWRGETVYGIRAAARDVAKGDKDEWMLAPYIEDNEGLPLGVLEGVLAAVDDWDNDSAADLEWQAMEKVDGLIAKAQRIESIKFNVPNLGEDAVLKQAEFVGRHVEGITTEQALALNETELLRLIFGVETTESMDLREQADLVWRRLDEYRDYVPGVDVVVGDPTPMFDYNPSREDNLSARITACINDQAARHIPDGLSPKQVKLLTEKIKIAKAASSNNGGFMAVQLEADAADNLATKIKGDEREVLPTYLAPEYPYDYEDVSHVLHLVVTEKAAVVEALKLFAAQVTEAGKGVKLAFSAAWNAEYSARSQAWAKYRRIKEAYSALREMNLAEMNLAVSRIPRHYLQGTSPTELASVCNALAHEVGDQYGMIREAAADALDVLIEDEEVWGRLYPAGNLGNEYESLLPQGTRDDVAEFSQLAVDKYDPSDLAFKFWDTQIARAAHIQAAVSRCALQTANRAGSAAFWEQPDAKTIVKDHQVIAQAAGFGRKMMIERDGVWGAAKVWRKNNAWMSEDGASWQAVDADLKVVDLEMVQFHTDALAEEAGRSIHVSTLTAEGILDPDGGMHVWDVLSRGVRLAFESDERKASFATAVLAHIEDPQAQMVGLSLQ